MNHAEWRRRTDLRSLDDHASWREVYYACHASAGGEHD